LTISKDLLLGRNALGETKIEKCSNCKGKGYIVGPFLLEDEDVYEI